MATKILKDYMKCALKTLKGRIATEYYRTKKCNKDLWLVSERGDDARDNGYFFFKYLREQHPEINAAYIIDNYSADYEKVKNLGRIVQYGSAEHYALMFTASKLISSHIMGFTPCPGFFVGVDKRVKLFKGKKVFLQHGIIKDNIEGLKYPNTDVDLFICGARPEFEYVVKNYYYPAGVVCYTGLARYDNLFDFDTKKQILLMPTWRKWINAYSIEEFKKNEYFRIYQSFLMNPKMNELLEINGYKLVFYPHYEIQKFLSMFTGGKNVIIASFSDFDVSTLLKESEVLITDYSSVYFDFAYMEKPVLYYQFDREKFFSEHYQKGYFDESTFGPVLIQEQQVVDALSQILCGKFKNEGYLKNIREFFEFHDCNNCDRIYNLISDAIQENI
ncbi:MULTISPECIES: CDP-glycerol glycerophosphotransferase family protein [Blautia]|uniref:CDP-glycerol glycerophosphotransferase family protein n=1 Tax=Blautia TaxID=572511 RepID=UPI000BA3CF28|nr:MULTISPECIES: CDP-glycerol glycerophosphotransferase family protein [Blautia]